MKAFLARVGSWCIEWVYLGKVSLTLFMLDTIDVIEKILSYQGRMQVKFTRALGAASGMFENKLKTNRPRNAKNMFQKIIFF